MARGCMDEIQRPQGWGACTPAARSSSEPAPYFSEGDQGTGCVQGSGTAAWPNHRSSPPPCLRCSSGFS